MSIIFKYLAKQIYITFLFILLSFISLFIFFDFLTEIKNIGKESYSTLIALSHVALQVPDRFYEFSPIACLISGVFVLSKLSIKSEFIVLRVSGITPFKLTKILLLIALPIVISIFLLGEFISPMTEKISQTIRINALKQNASSFKSGTWIKNDTNMYKEFIRIGNYTNTDLDNIYIYKFSNNYALENIIIAQKALIEKNIWNMNNVTKISFTKDSIFTMQKYANIDYKINISPSFFGIKLVDPKQLSIQELYKYIKYLKSSKQDSLKYQIALTKKVIYPFSVMLMFFICIPFAYLHSRNSGIGVKIFIGIMIGLSFYLFYTIFSQLSNFGSISSAWYIQSIPFIVYFLFGIIGYISVSKKG